MSVGNRQGDFRNLLDQMIQKNSGGQIKLRPEPDNKEQLPEEATKEQIEQQEIERALAGDSPDAEATEKEVHQLGDRMARSRQRLAMNNDPGKTTQTIQERIVKDFDALIEQARKQNAQSSGQPKPGKGEQMVKSQPGGKEQAQNVDKNAVVKKRQGGTTPKADSLSPGQSGIDSDLSQQIKQSAAEWGQVSPRTRNAVMEGADEKIIEKYRKYAEDYYRGVSVKGTERQ
jgi:hypothetical protein